MLVLVPPSESKAEAPRRGRPLDLDRLAFPELTAARSQVLHALVALGAGDDAMALLHVGASLQPEVARNTRLLLAPTRPAHDTYTGVLYDALDWPTLSPAARLRAARRLVVVSALWGALRVGDRVPPYRLSMDVDLPGVGPLAAHWRPALAPVLTAAAGSRGLIVDCRSSTYAAAWPVSGPVAERTVAVRVVREEAGRRTVVSHMAKHTRGLVTRHLMECEGDPRTPAALATHLRDVVPPHWVIEVTPPARAGRPWTLDVVIKE